MAFDRWCSLVSKQCKFIGSVRENQLFCLEAVKLALSQTCGGGWPKNCPLLHSPAAFLIHSWVGARGCGRRKLSGLCEPVSLGAGMNSLP